MKTFIHEDRMILPYKLRVGDMLTDKDTGKIVRVDEIRNCQEICKDCRSGGRYFYFLNIQEGDDYLSGSIYYCGTAISPWKEIPNAK
jgi:hypothetical protein